MKIGTGLRWLLLAAVSVLMFGLSSSSALGQLRAPLAIPLQYSGNFGEIRTGHFHTGMDIRTQGREGLPVLAAADGVISRLAVKSSGYGKALYFDSDSLGGDSVRTAPVTLVYAHLSAFHPKLEAWLMAEQYARKSWAIDIRPDAAWADTAFRFSAGDTICWSGNSGGSFGPHLHFEVRDRATQHPLNPLAWGLTDEDVVPPAFKALWLIPVDAAADSSGAVINSTETLRWTPEQGAWARVEGPVRLGVEAFDRMDGTGFVHGLYGLDVYAVGDSLELLHSHRMDELSFSTNKDVAAHTIYSRWREQKARIHRLHRLPGNRLRIYKCPAGMAPITVAPGDSLHLRVVLLDHAGNQSTVELGLTGSLPSDSTQVDSCCAPHPAASDHRQPFTVSAASDRYGRISADFPGGCFYQDTWAQLQSLDSLTFEVRSGDAALRSPYVLSCDIPAAPGKSQDPWVLCALDDDGEVNAAWTADPFLGRVKFRVKQFGRFALRQDSLPPVFGAPVLSGEGAGRVLRVKVEDELSGLARHGGIFEGKWLRVARDKGWLTYHFSDDRVRGASADAQAGKAGEVRFWAVDKAGHYIEIAWAVPSDTSSADAPKIDSDN